MEIKRLLPIIITLFFYYNVFANTGRYRLMFTNKPATEIIIGFDAYEFSTSNPTIFYSTSYINIANINTYQSVVSFTSNFSDGMYNHFTTLRNLTPNTVYYLVFAQDGNFSEVYNFKTLPDDDNTKLSIISGSDTQNQSELTKIAFQIISKLNPHFMLFQGNFTKTGSELNWQQWLDDWQFSISENNRLIPIIIARGNLENKNDQLINLFGCAEEIYDAHSFGENLLRVYTLNSEMLIHGNQTNWLLDDLITNNETLWKFAHYNTPMRPHSLFKREGGRQYANWASLFYEYNVNVVVEGGGFNAKTTWPVKPCYGGFNCDEGFERTNFGGTVYLGEGTLDCPLRNDFDEKNWTRSIGAFNQFKWLLIDTNQIEARTIIFNDLTNVDAIDQLDDSNRSTIPQNLNVWNNNAGDFVLFKKNEFNAKCTIIEPENNSFIPEIQSCIAIVAEVESSNSISKVDFFANDIFLGSSLNAPYILSWYPSGTGKYIISAKAIESNGNSSNLIRNAVFVGNGSAINVQSPIDINCEELSENSFGIVTDKNLKIKISDNSKSVQGLQFTDLNIPPKAKILSANIQFTAAGSNYMPATSIIKCEKNIDVLPFTKERSNISNRPITDNSAVWSVPFWTKEDRTINQKTPDLSSIIQEVVDMPNWKTEHPITFIISGTGDRDAKSEYSIMDSLNQTKADAPILSVEYLSTCPYDLNVSACNIISGEILTAQNRLYTNEPIPNSVNEIEYIAGALLEFNDNFEVKANTNFIADVSICY